MLGGELYPFALGRVSIDPAASSANAPVLLTGSPSGYLIVDLQRAHVAELSWPGYHRGPRIFPDSMDDGCWALCAERCSEGSAAYRIYWAYPFTPRVHYWLIDRGGCRLQGHDLVGDDLRRFLIIRRQEHLQYLVRLIQIAARDAPATLSPLLAELPERAIYESLEVAHLCCLHPDLFPPRDLGIARQLLQAFLVSALGHKASVPALASRIAPIAEILSKGVASASALCEKARLALAVAKGEGGDGTLHRIRIASGDEAQILRDACPTSFFFVMRLKPGSTAEFVVGSGDVNKRVSYTINLLNRFLARYISDPIEWQRFCETLPLGSSGPVRQILVHAGDAPPANCVHPAWAFERLKGDPRITLIPDLYYLASGGFRDLRHRMRESGTAWRDRRRQFFWRGSTTGWVDGPLTMENLERLPRYQLCRIGAGLRPTVDAAITSVCQTRTEAEAQKIEGRLKEAGIWSEFASKMSMATYKYLFEIDGNANSWGFLEKLLMGACVLKVESKWEQWFYARMEPWVHYVPIAGDLSDLAEKVDWCLAHEELCERIAAAGGSVAGGLQFDKQMKQLADLLVSSTSLSPGDCVMSATAARSSRATDLMFRLFGTDIYRGFQVNRPLDLQGWNSQHPTLANLIEILRPQIVLDVGVWKGASTAFLADLLRRHTADGVVIAIDTFLGSPEHWLPGSEMFNSLQIQHGYPALYWQFLSNIIQSNCEGYVIPLPQTSENAAAILRRLGLRADLIHLDAAHDYDSVLRDSRIYWELLNPGGALVGDDYHETWPGVVRAADEFASEIGLQLEIQAPKWVLYKPRT